MIIISKIRLFRQQINMDQFINVPVRRIGQLENNHNRAAFRKLLEIVYFQVDRITSP